MSAERRVALCEFVVRILPPDDEVSNETMDAALETVNATLAAPREPIARLSGCVSGVPYRLALLVADAYLVGVDTLGRRGFTVEVKPLDDDGEE